MPVSELILNPKVVKILEKEGCVFYPNQPLPPIPKVGPERFRELFLKNQVAEAKTAVSDIAFFLQDIYPIGYGQGGSHHERRDWLKSLKEKHSKDINDDLIDELDRVNKLRLNHLIGYRTRVYDLQTLLKPEFEETIKENFRDISGELVRATRGESISGRQLMNNYEQMSIQERLWVVRLYDLRFYEVLDLIANGMTVQPSPISPANTDLVRFIQRHQLQPLTNTAGELEPITL